MYLPLSIDLARFGTTLPFSSGLIATFGYHRFAGLDEDYDADLISNTQALLIEQFEDSPKINDMVKIIVDLLQKAEIVAAQLGAARDLNTITGVLLDIAGEILGVKRQGLTDEDYRKTLKLYTLLNKSCGEPETLIMALKTFTGATLVHYYEWYPAKVYMEYFSIFLPPVNLSKLLQKLAVGGVKVFLSWSNDTDPDFSFDGEGIYPPSSNTLGFGEVDYPNEGGRFVEFLF